MTIKWGRKTKFWENERERLQSRGQKMDNSQKRAVTKNATTLMCLAPRPGLEPGTNRLTVF